MDRTAFLDRVRTALSDVSAVELPQELPRTPASGDAADPERFLAVLAHNGGLGRVVARGELADAVTAIVRQLRSSRRVVVAPDVEPYREEVERGLTEARAEILTPAPDGWRQMAAAADLGITSAELAVAATGSILLVPGPSSPRVASLLPPVHVAVLPLDRLVPGFEEAMEEVAATVGRSSAPVLVTGPSRTSDIEMTTVIGVHGPKELHVLLVD